MKMFEEYYKNYWKMISKKVSETIKLFIDQNWCEDPCAKFLKLEKYD